MANQFRTTQYVLDDVLIRFWNSLSFVRTAFRELEGDFKSLRFATGQTVNYRLEERYLGGRGATANPEDRVQIIRPLTIDEQFHTMVSYSGMELTFDRARDEPYLKMANAPRAKRLANNVEKYVAREKLMNRVYQSVGTSGVPADFNLILSADTLATELGIPEDGQRYVGAIPKVTQSLANDLYTTYNDEVNSAALIDGFVGELSGFNFFKTNFLGRHLAGAGEAAGAPPTGYKMAGTITNGPITGGNTFQLTGLIANDVVFNDGDRLEVLETAGVFLVNPLTYDALDQRAQFIVHGTVISDGAGNATVTVGPEIVTSGARQNISAPIPNGAQIVMREDHNVSIAYHSQAIVFAAPPIKELRGGVEAVTSYSDLYKLALTYTLGADVKNYQQLDRIDMICGCTINPEFAVAIIT